MTTAVSQRPTIVSLAPSSTTAVVEGPSRVVVQNETRTVVARAQAGVVVVHRGYPGRDGDAVSSYDHTQASPASTWTIPHNLGRRPNVELRTVGGVVMDGQVTHVSNNLISVSFAFAIAGTARVI